MENCKETATPMCLKEKLSKNDEAENVDETLYRSLVSCLMYLTATRSDILYVVSLLSRFSNCAADTHFRAAKRVIRYVKGTLNFGIKLYANKKYVLQGYSSSDWGGSSDDMKLVVVLIFVQEYFLDVLRSKRLLHNQWLKLNS
ncbi:uncharacterized mitochondrial protein AtMg00240-like [Solanum tuberosum]|uniref:uncharacterized mitochondrial protein AtMg00240-like n=1 Tax=Solanum tuberosum TaxID=4113 RepID=UPI00073A4A4E|nr:PREDICTED: uncharacterized mitochondrial protein AtMg00240-like [Solanum tuberosum]